MLVPALLAPGATLLLLPARVSLALGSTCAVLLGIIFGCGRDSTGTLVVACVFVAASVALQLWQGFLSRWEDCFSALPWTQGKAHCPFTGAPAQAGAPAPPGAQPALRLRLALQGCPPPTGAPAARPLCTCLRGTTRTP